MQQKILLNIVQTWQLAEKTEYRGFKCGNCQKYLKKAWHYWLKIGSYKTPVHLCDNCQADFKINKIEVKSKRFSVERKKFNLRFSEKINKKLKKIIANWKLSKPIYKTFTCDNCSQIISKAYHIWINLNKTLSEVHLCKNCGKKFGF